MDVSSLGDLPWGEIKEMSIFHEIHELGDLLLSSKVTDTHYAASKMIGLIESYTNYDIGWYVFCTLLEGIEEPIYELETVLSQPDVLNPIYAAYDATSAADLLTNGVLTVDSILNAMLFTKMLQLVTEAETLELYLDDWLMYLHVESEIEI